MTRGLRLLPAQARAPVLVHPFEMHRIDGVLLALEPIAGHLRGDDLAEAVGVSERLPHRQLRRRLRTHIGPQQPGQLAHRIGGDGASRAAFRIGRGDLLIGLLDAGAVTRRTSSRDRSSASPSPRPCRRKDRRRGARSGARSGHSGRRGPCRASRSSPISRTGLIGVRRELAGAGDRHPIAAQQIAHRRAGPDAGKPIVLGGGEHRSSAPSRARLVEDVLTHFRPASRGDAGSARSAMSRDKRSA